MKLIFSLCIVTLLASCHQPVTAQTDAAAMEAYKKQKFRFEVRDCRLFYNEQQVILESLESFERFFGTNYIDSNGYYYYMDKPIEFFTEICQNDTSRICMNGILIPMGRVELDRLSRQHDSILARMPKVDGNILFNGVLVNADTRYEDINRQLKAMGKHQMTPFCGNIGSQTIAYDGGYCSPSSNCDDNCLVYITR
ncbi:MAG: hypothetical protein JXR39_04325 [Marinilabiliaceae bacterium]|nr:hypothetical protein [Marinilabiliaceae bacterium]